MKTRKRGDFAEFLAEAGAGSVKPAGASQYSPPPAAVPLSPEDELSLSIQGKKAVRPVKDKKAREDAGAEDEARSSDWQGNKVRLSTSGRKLAQNVEERVAWETRLKK